MFVLVVLPVACSGRRGATIEPQRLRIHISLAHLSQEPPRGLRVSKTLLRPDPWPGAGPIAMLCRIAKATFDDLRSAGSVENGRISIREDLATTDGRYRC